MREVRALNDLLFCEVIMRENEDCWTDEAGMHVPAEPIFSLSDGYVWVWANWHGNGAPVKLGEYKTVKAMMQDFLDQSALGERLIAKTAGSC
jgi:hypothetical protein